MRGNTIEEMHEWVAQYLNELPYNVMFWISKTGMGIAFDKKGTESEDEYFDADAEYMFRLNQGTESE